MTAASTSAAEPIDPTIPVVARGAAYYRRTRYIMVALILGFAFFFGYDGYKGWPEENRKYELAQRELAAAQEAGDADAITRWSEEQKQHKPRTEMDIRLQKFLCFALPPIGLLVLAWALYNSRGEYRLENRTLTVPGHGTFPIDTITSLDKKLWDRKGIAYAQYVASPSGTKKQFRLDDFIYEAKPIRTIVEQLEISLRERGAVEAAPHATADASQQV
jgi:hypothetical protein